MYLEDLNYIPIVFGHNGDDDDDDLDYHDGYFQELFLGQVQNPIFLKSMTKYYGTKVHLTTVQ
jgi:hypothetical protein